MPLDDCQREMLIGVTADRLLSVVVRIKSGAYLLLTGCEWGWVLLVSMGTILVSPNFLLADYEEDIIAYAAMGDPSSQYALALLYEYGGEAVEKDPVKAVEFFTLSAAKNVAGACLYLGLKYEFGNGVEQDYNKAICHYLCAAKQDWPMAQYLLAAAYMEGKGVNGSPLIALCWLDLARQYGYPKAEQTYKKLEKQVEPGDLQRIPDLQKKLMVEKIEACE